MDNLNEFLVSIVIGIRYRLKFTISDNIGSIVDDILFGKKSELNSSLFTQVTSDTDRKILHNDKNGSNMIIGPTDLVLRYNFQEKTTKSEINNVVAQFDRTIVQEIMKKYNFDQINRLGQMRLYNIPEKLLTSTLQTKISGDQFKNVNEFDIRFTNKSTPIESIALKQVNDYFNSIVHVSKKPNSNYFHIDTDYQHLYDPALDSYYGLKVMDFNDLVEKFNNTTVLSWLNG